ncbi:hypothetical protein ACVDFE_23375 [Lentzea chajnantorensis]
MKTSPPAGSAKRYVPVNGVSAGSAALSSSPVPVPEIRRTSGAENTAVTRPCPVLQVRVAGSAVTSAGAGTGTRRSNGCMPLRCETRCTSSA